MEAATFVESAGKQLGKWIVDEVEYLYAVKDKVEGLQSELEWIQCFLKEADAMKNDNEMIRKWISEITDFAYEAENILESYLLKVSHPRENGIWNMVKWSSCVLGDAKSTHKVGSEIDVLTSKISKLTSRMVTYGVKTASYGESSSIGPQSKKAELRRTHSHLPVDDIVGWKDDIRVIVNELMNKERKVIAISGMPGSGKTTLCRKVYQEVKEHQFEMCAWVFVSRKFQAKELRQEILLKLFADDQTERNDIRNAGDDELVGRLYRVLQRKKCLVVLDDVWGFRDWNVLKDSFPISNSRSKLLITTRNTELISHVDPQGFSHQPQPLGKQDSLNLFYDKAFLSKDAPGTPLTTRSQFGIFQTS